MLGGGERWETPYTGSQEIKFEDELRQAANVSVKDTGNDSAAAIHFMRNKGREKVIDACLQHPSVREHLAAGKRWESPCKTWWESFAHMCVFAWRSTTFTGADLGRLRGDSVAMGTARNELTVCPS